MPQAETSVVLSSRHSELERLWEVLDRFAEQTHLPPRVVAHLQLALDEVVANVISHGYGGNADGEIRVRLLAAEDAVIAEVEDDAAAFNPLEVPPPDLTVPLADRTLGGLGMHLATQVMDHIQYERRGDVNVLRLRKNLYRV